MWEYVLYECAKCAWINVFHTHACVDVYKIYDQMQNIYKKNAVNPKNNQKGMNPLSSRSTNEIENIR